MKTRLITGISGALFAIAMVIFMQTPFLVSIPLAFFAATAFHEIMHVIKCENKLIIALGMVVAGSMPILYDVKSYFAYHKGVEFFNNIDIPMWVPLTVFTFIVLIIMLSNYEKTRFEHAAMAIFSAFALGAGFSTMLCLRDLDHVYPDYFQPAQTLTIVLTSLYACWISDAAAYFAGRKLGKHKLAPVISPKKSIEGAVGGTIINEIITMVTWVIASHWFDRYPDTISLWLVAVIAIVANVMSIAGDLSASVIKRNFGAKDYGTFFPGHGGIMDRFDSFLFALPTVYLIITMIMHFAA